MEKLYTWQEDTSAKDNEFLELFDISFNATKDYVLRGIQNDINYLYYQNTAADISTIYNTVSSIDDLIYGLLAKSQSLKLKRYSKSFFYNGQKYDNMAIEHALDICFSIKRRFG
jgi:hypothetical protein